MSQKIRDHNNFASPVECLDLCTGKQQKTEEDIHFFCSACII